MARADTVTKLPLDRWAEFMGINPIHFNQCNIPALQNAVCGSGWFQRDWQDTDRVSREQLAHAISQAEEMIESFLGFRLLPSWEVEEYHSFEARPLRPEFYNLSARDVRGRNTGIRLDWGYFISGGIEAKSLVQANRTIAWTDEDGDGYEDTGTVTATVTAGQDECEIEVYYPGKSGDDSWRIREAVVSISGTTATITFKRERCLLEEFTSGFDVRAQDYTDDTKFLTEVDVYRHYNDPQTQATLLWESNGCDCNTADCPQCGFNAQTACIRVRDDDRMSFVGVSPGEWDATNEQFTALTLDVKREPDAVKVWYRAGWRNKRLSCPNDQMDRDLAFAVSVLAASMLDRKICDCRGPHEAIARWQADTAFIKGATEMKQVKPQDCPFGTRAGAVEAWRRINRPGVQKAKIGRAILT